MLKLIVIKKKNFLLPHTHTQFARCQLHLLFNFVSRFPPIRHGQNPLFFFRIICGLYFESVVVFFHVYSAYYDISIWYSVDWAGGNNDQIKIDNIRLQMLREIIN